MQSREDEFPGPLFTAAEDVHTHCDTSDQNEGLFLPITALLSYCLIEIAPGVIKCY